MDLLISGPTRKFYFGLEENHLKSSLHKPSNQDKKLKQEQNKDPEENSH